MDYSLKSEMEIQSEVDCSADTTRHIQFQFFQRCQTIVYTDISFSVLIGPSDGSCGQGGDLFFFCRNFHSQRVDEI